MACSKQFLDATCSFNVTEENKFVEVTLNKFAPFQKTMSKYKEMYGYEQYHCILFKQYYVEERQDVLQRGCFWSRDGPSDVHAVPTKDMHLMDSDEKVFVEVCSTRCILTPDVSQR
jgi:hypothetical protein